MGFLEFGLSPTFNTTPEYWEVDGISLQTYAYNISTWGDTRQEPPPLRGDNITVPHATGATWVPKVPDSRTITLQMWVSSANPDGSTPPLALQRQNFRENWEELRRLLWNPYRQMLLSKRVRLHTQPGQVIITDGPVIGADANGWMEVTAQAQFVGGLTPTMHSNSMATFTVDLFLADPFFYGAHQTVSSGGTVIGDARTEDLNFTLAPGQQLTNNTANVWCKNNASTSLHLDTRRFKAMNGSANWSGAITHSGNPFWMVLDPGPVDLAGGVSVSYAPRWF